MEAPLAVLAAAAVLAVLAWGINLLTDNPHVKLARWLGRLRRGN